MSVSSPDWLHPQEAVCAARSVLAIEAEAIQTAAARLDGGFSKAVDILSAHWGKVMVTGVGKSGRVAEKIAATFCSTGTPSVFLHPVDAAHGDLGIYSPGDPTVLISKSGSTVELLRLLPLLRELKSPLIGILGNPASPLAAQVDAVIDASVRTEADPHNLAPTASTTVAMALGDALAVALMQARQFAPEDFARFHPGGQLGRNLRYRVADVMQEASKTACAAPEDPLRSVIIAMTERPLGAACVIDEQGILLGLITDGDLRRALRSHEDIRGLRACDVMTRNPVVVSPDASLASALRLMEDRPSQISVLPVVGANGVCLGLLRLHDIHQAAGF